MSDTRATPDNAAAMREHLAEGAPTGHGVDDAADDADYVAMSAMHAAMHGAGAGHEHAMMRATPAYDQFEIRGPALWPDADFDFRMLGDGLEFRGYVAVFNRESLPIPGGPRGAFRETVRSGAFNDTLSKNPDITLRTQHNLVMLPLARTKSGTMTLSTDEHGLLAAGSLPDNEAGHIARDAVRRGDVDGMSMRFRVPSKAGEKWTANYSQRELLAVQLGSEVSIVDFPAYPDTSIAVRQLAEEAHVEPDALAEAFQILREPDAKLTVEQRDLLYSVVGAKTGEPIAPLKAKARLRLAELHP